jgi:predicted phage-related endonuclease
MVSRNQKALYLATGGIAAATFIWLRYAKSASGTRTFLSEAGARAAERLADIQEGLSTLRKRAEEVEGLVHELAHIGSERLALAETVINDTLKRIEQTADVIQANLVQSSNEISALFKDTRNSLEHAISTRPPRAA